MLDRIFPLSRGRLIAVALITSIPSFIFGLLIHANIAGMVIGLVCFMFTLLRIWPKQEATLMRYPVWTLSLRITILLRVIQSLAGAASFLALRFEQGQILAWTLTPDILGGLCATMALLGPGGNLREADPFILCSGFTNTLIVTFLQGLLLFTIMVITMLPIALAVWIWRKLMNKTPIVTSPAPPRNG